MMRENGEVRVAHDHHVEGLFPRSTWTRVLQDVGFEVEEVACREAEVEGTPYTPLVWVARRP